MNDAFKIRNFCVRCNIHNVLKAVIYAIYKGRHFKHTQYHYLHGKALISLHSFESEGSQIITLFSPDCAVSLAVR